MRFILIVMNAREQELYDQARKKDSVSAALYDHCKKNGLVDDLGEFNTLLFSPANNLKTNQRSQLDRMVASYGNHIDDEAKKAGAAVRPSQDDIDIGKIAQNVAVVGLAGLATALCSTAAYVVTSQLDIDKSYVDMARMAVPSLTCIVTGSVGFAMIMRSLYKQN